MFSLMKISGHYGGAPLWLLRVITPKKTYDVATVKKPTARALRKAARRKARLLVDVITRRPIYLAVSSTDCDHVTVNYATRLDNIWGLEKFEYDLYESAEGATSYRRITLSEYRQYVPSSRDGILEAYENGHPHSVRG